MTTTRTISVASALLLAASVATAQDRVAVRFETRQPTVWGESVYVLGDRPELGGGDPTRALRMVPAGPSQWRLDVALPAGAPYRVVYVVRDNAPRAVGDRSNSRAVSGVIAGAASGKARDRSVRVRYLSGFQAPSVRFVRRPGQVEERALTRVGAGRGGSESLWEARVETTEAELELSFRDGSRQDLAPGGGAYRTTRRELVVCDGQVLPDVPPARRSASRILRVQRWYSNRLRNQRDVFVYLPRDYDGSTRRYPVIYAHDGQNLFGPDAMFGGWRLEEALDRLIAQGLMEEVIVVAPANTPARMDEYMPPEEGGTADDYARFLVDELKPWVDRSWRTRTDAASTATLGSSLGGLVSMYLGWERPDVFGRVGSLSGSFWLEQHLQTVQAEPRLGSGDARRALRVWLDSGTAGSSADSCDDTVAMRDALLNHGLVLGRDVQHRIDVGAGHSEPYWRARVGDALRFLFPAE